MHKKKLLILSYYSPIENTPRAIQLLGALHLLKNEFIIDLFIPKVETRVENNFRYNLYNLKLLNIFQIPCVKFTKQSIINRIIRRLIKLISYPDVGIIFSIYCFFKLCNKNRYDIILSFSNPFSITLLGAILKKFNVGRRLISDVGDPFNELKKKGYLFNQLERFTSKEIDKIILPIRSISHKFPFIPNNNKIFIRQIYPSKKIPTNYRIDSEKINILYAGEFYSDIRNPEIFLKAIGPLINDNKVVFHYFGNISNNYKYLKKLLDIVYDVNNVHFNNSISREELISIMEKMDLLVNIDNNNMYGLPSKLIDYEISKTPVLTVCSSNNNSRNTYISENSIEEIKSSIFSVIKRQKLNISLDDIQYRRLRYLKLFKS